MQNGSKEKRNTISSKSKRKKYKKQKKGNQQVDNPTDVKEMSSLDLDSNKESESLNQNIKENASFLLAKPLIENGNGIIYLLPMYSTYIR